MTDKALKACAEYARLSAEIKALTKAIGDALDGCPGQNGKRSSLQLEDGEIEFGGDNDETHLKGAYTPIITEPTYYSDGETRYLSDKQMRARLACCSACLSAHEAIQARRAARKSLGAVKRHITMLGRAENARNSK